MPAVLTSRWGFAPVVVATASDVEDSSPSGSREDSIISSIIHASSGDCASDETGMSAATGTPPNSLMTVHVAASAPPAGTPLPQSLLPLDENSGDSKEDEEPTGGMLWDCAKVLYDLLADPSATNEFSIKGKSVLELGGGTGALSVGLARAGAASVTCTDLPCHLARIESTLAANKRCIRTTDDNGKCFNTDDQNIARNRANCSPGTVVNTTTQVSIRDSISRTSSDPGSCKEGDSLTDGHRQEYRRTHTNICNSSNGNVKADVELGTAIGVTFEEDAFGLRTCGVGGLRYSGIDCSASRDVAGDIVIVAALRWGDAVDIANVWRAQAGVPISHEMRTEGERETTQDERKPQKDPDNEGVAHGERKGRGRTDGAFDVIVLSEVLYWPALDLLEEDTREPLRHTLVELSEPGTRVVLIYKERWLEREKEFLKSCEGGFRVVDIPSNALPLPACTTEEPGSDAIRAVVMTRLSTPNDS